MDPLYLMTSVAMGVLFWLRRAEILTFRWQPTRSTGAVFVLSAAIVACSLVLTQHQLGLTFRNLVLHGGIYVVLGVWAPLIWTTRIEGKGLEALGLHRRKLLVSVLINLGLGAFLAVGVFFQADWAQISPARFGAALFVLLTGNFFEAIFYYGFVHLRLRDAFGPLPAVLMTSCLYVTWHIGTELSLVENPLATAAMLLVVGLLYQSVFAWTYNLLIIFPFFVGAGVMMDFAVNMSVLDEVAPFAGWALATWVAFGLGFALWGRRKTPPAQGHTLENPGPQA